MINKINILFSKRNQLLILFVIALGLNINTLLNGYAMDDEVVMTQNKFVAKGIKGIPEIVSQDFFKGWQGTDDNELSGGRYRPFTLVIFAIEFQFFGASPLVSHLINILLFALLIALLFKLLQSYIFREQNRNLAFITCLLFTVHPIHTEVVANVKSRDEIITFILLIVSLITIIKHTEKRSIVFFAVSLFCFFIALLTKESAVICVGLVPLIFYFFFNKSAQKSILFSLPFAFIFISYLAIRYIVIGFSISTSRSVLNAPFLYASASEAFATKVFILFKYLLLLVFPFPLSCDYGYNQIPYINIFSLQFILSLSLILGLIVYAFYTFKKRSLFSFCILYFFASISIAANFIFDIGTPLAERMLFLPSLSFCIVAAAFYIKIESRWKVLANSALLAALLIFSGKTYLRNADWKNNETLFLADVISSPNSAKTNLIAAEQYILKAKKTTDKELKNECLKKAVYYGERSLKIYHFYSVTYLDLGTAYFELLDYFKTADLWIQAYNLNPSNLETKNSTEMLSIILFKEGKKFYTKGIINNAIKCYVKSIELSSGNAEVWYNLGGNYFLINDTKNAIDAWQNVLKLAPNYPIKPEDFHKH